jgi:broad specificity phosphatase PhoE
MQIDWKTKYLKYKTKYIELKSNQIQTGGFDVTNCVKIIFVRHGESTENIALEKGKSYDPDNIVLTDLGIEQATKTGKYLTKTFGKFDKVFSSPVTRCVQTSNLIMEQIGFPPESIKIDDLLVEIGFHNDNSIGLSKDQKEKFLKKNNKILNLQKQIENISNPFDVLSLNIKLYNEYNKYLKMNPNPYEAKLNCEKFLDKLKNYHDIKQILVVTHGGIISLIQKFICNIDIENRVQFSKKNFDSINELFGNCTILCIYFDPINLTYKLVSPANTYHLIR